MTKEHKEVSGVLDNAVLLYLGDGHTVMWFVKIHLKLYKRLSIKSCTNYTLLKKKKTHYKKDISQKKKKKKEKSRK